MLFTKVKCKCKSWQTGRWHKTQGGQPHASKQKKVYKQ